MKEYKWLENIDIDKDNASNVISSCNCDSPVYFLFILYIFSNVLQQCSCHNPLPPRHSSKKQNYRCDIKHDFLSHVISVLCFIFLLNSISLCLQSFIQPLLSGYYTSETMPGDGDSKMNRKQALYLGISYLHIKMGIFNPIKER